MDSLSALSQFIDDHPRLTALRARVEPQLEDDPGHDIHHSLRVALWTLRIGGDRVDPVEAVAAALLHDVVNLPKDHEDRALASERSAGVARTWLVELGFDMDESAVARVADAVRTHSFSRGEEPRSALGDALQDADRLEALGALGLFRCISTGAKMGATYFDPGDPWAAQRPLEDRRFSVDHFFTKLLTLPGTMRTAAGRAEAERRSAFLERTLDQLGVELGAPRTGRGSRLEQP